MQARSRTSSAGLLLALFLLLLAGPALAQPKFPALGGRVVDAANILPPATEAELTQKLEALEAQTGSQLVVATVPDLQGYEIEDYGYQLGRAWGIGQAEKDNGALLIVAPNERRVRVEVGYGLEPVLTDALSSVIVQQRILPHFRAGDMAGGVVAGTDAIIAQLGLPPEQARANAAQAEAMQARAAERRSVGPGAGLWMGLIAVWLFFSFIRRSRGRKYGRRRGFGAPIILWGPGLGGGWGGGGGGWGGGGGFSGGGGSFGGGGSSGSW